MHQLIHANAAKLLEGMLCESSEEEKEGDEVGVYQLCDCLGEGGFSRVWRAEQTGPVRREVAIKLIKPGMDTIQVRARFTAERRALASLDHRHIATLRTAGVSRTGRPYFAMELVRDGCITTWCKSHNASVSERVRLFIQVCQAVQHAHRRGILHRDLKPSNILIGEIDGRPAAKVIDFGMAKGINGNTLDEARILTQAGKFLGTPLYTSPEQIEAGLDLDVRTDVYALGVLLYELLTGVTPLDSDPIQGGAINAMKRCLLKIVPDRPSTRLRFLQASAQIRVGDVAGELDRITMRALEKDRKRRYPTAAALATDLQRFLDGNQSSALPAPAPPPRSARLQSDRSA